MLHKEIVTQEDQKESRKRLQEFTFSYKTKKVGIVQKVSKLLRDLFRFKEIPN